MNHGSIVATIIQEIKNTIRGEPHTLSEIRYMIEDARIAETDFIDVLHQHHRFLNESIVVLMDNDSMPVEKQIHLDRFLKLLDVHGRAEEETLYRSLVRHTHQDVRREGLVGRDEHALIFQLADGLKASPYMSDWTEDIDAKANVLASIVETHLFEEESEMFPLVKKALIAGEMHVLATDYLDLCEFYLDGYTRSLAPSFMNWPISP